MIKTHSDAELIADAILDSAVRTNLQPRWTLPIVVAGKFKAAQWAAAAESAGCAVPDQETKVHVVELLKERVSPRRVDP